MCYPVGEKTWFSFLSGMSWSSSCQLNTDKFFSFEFWKTAHRKSLGDIDRNAYKRFLFLFSLKRTFSFPASFSYEIVLLPDHWIQGPCLPFLKFFCLLSFSSSSKLPNPIILIVRWQISFTSLFLAQEILQRLDCVDFHTLGLINVCVYGMSIISQMCISFLQCFIFNHNILCSCL